MKKNFHIYYIIEPLSSQEFQGKMILGGITDVRQGWTVETVCLPSCKK